MTNWLQIAQVSTEAGDEEEEEDELPEVVIVSKVMHLGKQFLVDKRSGLVYSSNIEEPEQIGRWTNEEGIILDNKKDELWICVEQQNVFLEH